MTGSSRIPVFFRPVHDSGRAQLVYNDISDFEEAGEAVPGGVPERQWHHHVEDDEL